ncbi:hypothetical protein NPIL_668411 [Nephila pilipes]|uniref:Uncharacterized protein n=1 Tax=Nephila pilipes TaxID=299642 RepID=A0A8X6TQ28_NEPPI|nr:hypothetical protein NPIL_668411 [Nephila pilipes]
MSLVLLIDAKSAANVDKSTSAAPPLGNVASWFREQLCLIPIFFYFTLRAVRRPNNGVMWIGLFSTFMGCSMPISAGCFPYRTLLSSANVL